jgi:hypothetical protein
MSKKGLLSKYITNNNNNNTSNFSQFSVRYEYNNFEIGKMLLKTNFISFKVATTHFVMDSFYFKNE